MRPLRLSDQVLRAAGEIAGLPDVLDAERWASDWLGEAWLAAPLGERDPERQMCLEVIGRACTRPSQQGLAAVAALRRVAPEGEALTVADATHSALRKGEPGSAPHVPPGPPSGEPRPMSSHPWRVWSSDDGPDDDECGRSRAVGTPGPAAR